MSRRIVPRWLYGCLLVGAILNPGASVAGQIFERGPPPFIVTPDHLVGEMLNLAEVEPGDRVYDLGSGDGRLVIAAGAAGALGVGVEYDSRLVELSRANAAERGLASRVQILHGDIFETDVSDADVVMLYLSPEFNLRLRPRLLAQLRPGSRVVSHAFHMGDWAPDSTVTIGTGAGRATLFSWVVPEVIDGFWSLRIDGYDPLNLEIFQEFQLFSGTVRRDGRELPLHDGSLRGRKIRFELVGGASDANQRLVFSGEVVDGAIQGLVDGGPGWGRRSWTAFRLTDPARPLPNPGP